MARSPIRSRSSWRASNEAPCDIRVSLFRAARLPRRSAIFPPAVGQLAYARAVLSHQKQFAVRLRDVVIQRALVFEAIPCAAEDNPLAVTRPDAVRVIAGRASQTSHVRPIRFDRVDLEIALSGAGEGDSISPRGPRWKRVVAGRQRRYVAVVQRHNPEPLVTRARDSIHDVRAVRGPARESAI